MRRVDPPRFKDNWKNKKPTGHKYYRCPVSGCPFVVTIEKPKPKPKDPFANYPKFIKPIPWPREL